MVKSTNAKQMVIFLYENIISQFGCLKILISDRGYHFLNDAIVDLTELFNITHRKTTPYHPQTRDIIVVLKDTLNTTSGPLPIPDPHATGVPSNTLERHSIGSCVVDGVRDLVTSSSMAKLVGSITYDSTFTYQKETKNTSLVDLLFNKGVVDSHSLHKVFHSFLKVVPSERTSIATGVPIVDNIESIIQVGRHAPRVVLFDTGAQPVILRVQFIKNMGMLDSKPRKSMWQIRIASWNVEEVFGESSDLIALNFNEGID